MSSVGGREVSFSEGSGLFRTASAGAGMSGLASTRALSLAAVRRLYQKYKPTTAPSTTSTAITAPATAPPLISELPPLDPPVLLGTHVTVGQVSPVLQDICYEHADLVHVNEHHSPTGLVACLISCTITLRGGTTLLKMPWEEEVIQMHS